MLFFLDRRLRIMNYISLINNQIKETTDIQTAVVMSFLIIFINKPILNISLHKYLYLIIRLFHSPDTVMKIWVYGLFCLYVFLLGLTFA
jgi:hypothetical protein